MNSPLGVNVPSSTSPKKSRSKAFASFTTTVILILLICIAVIGIMTAKRFFEAQQTTVNKRNIEELTEFVNDNPNSIEARLGLAYAFQRDKQYDEAREQYLEVLKVEATNQAAMYNLAEIDRLNKDYPAAESRLKTLLAKYEYHVLGSISLAQVYIETKKYDDAVKLMDKMIKGSPQTIDYYVLKAEALARKGNKTEAKATYEKALKFDPTNQDIKQSIENLK